MRAFNDQHHVSLDAEELGANIAEMQRLVRTMEADLGVVIGPGAERLYVIDDRGVEVPTEKALLLFVKLVAQQASKGEKIVLPLTVTHIAEHLERTKVSLPELAKASLGEDVVFAGALGGGYIFPQFLPAFDAVMSLGKLLELLAPQAAPLSRQIAEIPTSTLLHKTIACPWSLKGTVMRTAAEQLQQRASTASQLSMVDGLQLSTENTWVQLLPDADEPVFHVFAEGTDHADSERLAEEFLGVVRAVIEEDGR